MLRAEPKWLEPSYLAQLVKQARPTHERAVELMIDVADGLAAIHSQQIYHRDLKPGNILPRRAFATTMTRPSAGLFTLACKRS